MDHESSVAKLDFLIEDERARFNLAAERIKTYETEAAASITAGIGLGAATLAGFSERTLSGFAAIGLLVGGLFLIAAVFAGILSRREPEPLIRIGKYEEGAIAEYDAAARAEKEAEDAVRALSCDAPAGELRQQSLALWRARTGRAQLAATAKERMLRFSLAALYFAVLVLAVVAGGEFLPALLEP